MSIKNVALLAQAVSVALASAAAHAQVAAETKTMGKISVEAKDEPAAKVDRVSSPKFSTDLVDTPQTIAVVSQEVLRQQGATTLSQALRNTPGVTFLLGENGNTATGDSIFMRGFDTQGSIFIDGIRDLGSVTRDTFNTEQVEIAKGPAGPDYGRGAASGYVNLSSKVPVADNFISGATSYGTADNGRVTGDINHAFGESTAVRLNVMGQDGDVEGRDFITRKGWAVAPAVAFGLDGDTRSYFFLLHTEQDNVPDGGVSTIGLDGFYNVAFDPDPPAPALPGPNAGVRPERADSSNYYGLASDFEQIKGTMLTARFEHDFSDDLSIRNTSRFGHLRQFYVLSGVNAVTATDPNPDLWTVARTRQAKFQENDLFTNQTNVTWNVTTGAVAHDVTGGLEFIDEEQKNPTYVGLGTPITPASVYHPNRNDMQPGYAPVRNGVFTDGETQTIGAYVFDTMSFAGKWQVTGGFRLDSFDTRFDNAALVGTAPNQVLTPGHLQVNDTLFSYKLGVVFKPTRNGSVYLSTATSQQPPGGANFQLSTTANNANRADLKPTVGTNVELGVKWNLRDGALAVTGAVYDSRNRDELIADPTDSTRFIQVGERQVKGVELGLVGKVTDNWEVSAGVAKMDTEVTRGNANQTGSAINWSPRLTFSSWTTYTTPSGLSIGAGARYVDSVARAINTTANLAITNTPTVPEYWVFDAMLGYRINEKVQLQLNAYNLADEDYVQSLNNGGSRYIPGTPRSALLTVNFSF